MVKLMKYALRASRDCFSSCCGNVSLLFIFSHILLVHFRFEFFSDRRVETLFFRSHAFVGIVALRNVGGGGTNSSGLIDSSEFTIASPLSHQDLITFSRLKKLGNLFG